MAWWIGSRYLRVVPDTGSCTYTGASEGNGTCVSTSSSSSSAVRAQYNTTRWMRPDLERTNLFVFINTELDSGVEAYSEIGMYNSLATQQLIWWHNT